MKNVCKPYARARSTSTLALLTAAACNPADFADYEKSAPIRVHTAPESATRQQDYGSVIATVSTQEDGREVAYIASSPGRGAGIVISRAFSAGAADESTKLRCGTPVECRDNYEDIGGTLIGVEVWGLGTDDEGKGCAFSPTSLGTSTQGWVVCDSRAGGDHFPLGLSDLLGEGERLHYSGFGLPAGHPLGIALLGAHAELVKGGGGRSGGGVYRVPDRAELEQVGSVKQLKLRDPASGESEPQFFGDADERGDLGREVTGLVTVDGELLVAISQPSERRVIVATYDDSLEGPVEERFVTRACVAAPDAELRGFGERLLLGDVTGDGRPELFVGSDPIGGIEPGREALYMYEGSGLPNREAAESACPEWDSEPDVVPCEERGEVACADAAFGASLAVGDIDGDGRGDLLVGAPDARVAGVVQGATWILPGAEGGLALERAVTLTSAGENARFGAAVATVSSKGGRAEPVIGAPGLSEVFVYTCTPLEDAFDPANQCLP